MLKEKINVSMNIYKNNDLSKIWNIDLELDNKSKYEKQFLLEIKKKFQNLDQLYSYKNEILDISNFNNKNTNNLMNIFKNIQNVILFFMKIILIN